ncbi:MAG: hypothetical protein E7437_02405 [Ruminococcaceae bacterium]|nr:hypothetical protein [Oscillospiraceae bacterium]
MNILADEQQKIFEPGISEEERARREQEFYDLYYKTRKKDETSFLGKLSLKTRKQLGDYYVDQYFTDQSEEIQCTNLCNTLWI